MPWKLILFIILVVFVAIFMGANLDNKSSVSLIFYTTQPIPVYLIILYSFCAGVVLMLPFTIGKRNKASKKAEKTEKEKKPWKNPVNFYKTETKMPESADSSSYEDKT